MGELKVEEIDGIKADERDYCLAINTRAIKDNADVIALPGNVYRHIMSTLKIADKAVNHMCEVVTKLETENKAIKGLRTQLINLARKQGTMESGILIVGDEQVVIPGFNGPRPEHAHLSRDTMQDVVVHGSKYRAKREKRNGEKLRQL